MTRHIVNMPQFKELNKDPDYYLELPEWKNAPDTDKYPYVFGAIKPRDYQLEGIKWLHEHKRAAIWDEPGLGKTITAAYASVRPVIVAAPLYLCQQWYEVLKTGYNSPKGFIPPLFPDDKVNLCTSSKMDRLARSYKLIEKADWYIINHEMLRYQMTCNQRAGKGCEAWNEFAKCQHPKIAKRFTAKNGVRYVEFEYPLPPALTLLIDEAHHLRGRNAIMSRGAVELAKDMPFAFELSATPIYKHADDLYMQLRIIHPLLFSDYWKFLETWCQLDESEGFKSKIIGTRYVGALTKMMGRYGIKRSYAETGRELPKDIHNAPIMISMTDTERRKRDALVDNYRDEDDNPIFNAGTMIDKLTELSCTPLKLDTARTLVDEVRYRTDGSDRGVILFTWLRETAHKVTDLLNKSGHNAVCITGELAAEKRGALAKKNMCVVANLAALSEGVDLSHLHHVIFFELYYVPGLVFGQALPRVLRERINAPNDAEPVIIDYLIVEGSIDEVKYESVTTREMDQKQVMARMIELSRKLVAEMK